jgi:hypothetical protein
MLFAERYTVFPGDWIFPQGKHTVWREIKIPGEFTPRSGHSGGAFINQKSDLGILYIKNK